MKVADENDERNPLIIEAQADELEAEALRLRTRAKPLRAQAAELLPPLPITSAHMTRAEYAQSRRVSEATVSRWAAEGMPTETVGFTYRMDPVAGDSWRRERGRKPTTPAKSVDDPVDLDVDLGPAGLRLVVRGGRGGR